MALRRRKTRTLSPPIEIGDPPPGVDDLTLWFNEAAIGLRESAAEYPTCARVRSLQALLSAWGRVKGAAVRVETVLKARKIREGEGYELGEEPPDDPMVLPLWHAHRLAVLFAGVAGAEDFGEEDGRSIAALLKVHTAGVSTRETAETESFMRQHGIKDPADVVRRSETEFRPGPREESAQTNLIEFAKYVNPMYQVGNHHLMIAETLEKVARGELTRVMINLPPRHGKTQLVSRYFPAWYLGRYPKRQIIAATYAQELADDIGRSVRNQIGEPEYQRIFPGTTLAEDSQAAKRFHTNKGGVYYSVGVGGAGTGLGAHCFPAGTMVDTTSGVVPIEKLCEGEPPLVLTRSGQGELRFRRILAARQIWADRFTTIITASGRVLRCTPNHPIGSGNRYIRADELTIGAPLWCGDIAMDRVARVRTQRAPREPVYDIQVEEDENFFANGILVHNCLLIDDPLKGREEADSPTIRRRLHDWYASVAYTRLMPGNSAIAIISTRWHSEDLCGWLLKNHAHEGWVVISLPALAERDEEWLAGGKPWRRATGDALWPDWYDERKLAQIQRAVGPREWNALYQQRPVAAEGNMCKIAWFRRFNVGEQPSCKRVFISIDTGQKGGANNDPTVATVIGEAESGYYLLDLWRDRVVYPQLVPKVRELIGRWSPNAVLIEDQNNGATLLQDLGASEIANRHPLIGIRPKDDKPTRFARVTPMIEAGRVWVPNPSVAAPWVADFEEEIGTFPLGHHDDMVDALSQFLNWIRKETLTVSSAGGVDTRDPHTSAVLSSIGSAWGRRPPVGGGRTFRLGG